MTCDGARIIAVDTNPTAPTDLLVVIPDQGADDPNGASFTDWWNGTHNTPYINRDLHRSFPLILKALVE